MLKTYSYPKFPYVQPPEQREGRIKRRRVAQPRRRSPRKSFPAFARCWAITTNSTSSRFRSISSRVGESTASGWKLKLVADRTAPERLLDTYNEERAYAADETWWAASPANRTRPWRLSARAAPIPVFRTSTTSTT
jgi:hypothetical protein